MWDSMKVLTDRKFSLLDHLSMYLLALPQKKDKKISLNESPLLHYSKSSPWFKMK